MKKSKKSSQRKYYFLIFITIVLNVVLIIGIKKYFDSKHAQDFLRLEAERMKAEEKRKETAYQYHLYELTFNTKQHVNIELISKEELHITDDDYLITIKVLDNSTNIPVRQFITAKNLNGKTPIADYTEGIHKGVIIENNDSTKVYISSHYLVYEYILQKTNKGNLVTSSGSDLFSQILISSQFLTDIKDFGYPNPAILQNKLDTFYNGEISFRVPYPGLKFIDIDLQPEINVKGALDQEDYHFGDTVVDGYTFVSTQHECYTLVAEEDKTSNPGSFISTELYSYGPTVIRMETRLGWCAPVTGRYFYTVIGQDHYGPNFKSEIESRRTFNGNKYGKYTLKREH